MGKLGKLAKLKSAITKLTKQNSATTSTISAATATHSDQYIPSARSELIPVYVGKSRRQYHLSSDIIDHPLFQELVVHNENEGVTSVACEVVLFEHLLWMLRNSESSMDELVPFYGY